MEIRTYKVYKFKELSKEGKEKVLMNLRDINTDDDFWCECTLEDWKEKLKEHGFNDAEIFFSGFWSQGDGACFDATLNLDQYLKGQYRVLRNKDLTARVVKNGYGFRYSHERTRYLEIDANNIELTARQSNLVDKLQAKLEALRLDLSQQIYKQLKEQFEYMQSDEVIIDTIEVNDYDFTDDGKID